MCLILLQYQPDAPEPLIVAANRDEFHHRASAPAHFWQDRPDLLAGRDLVAGGTWLGCTREGRFAALTNFNQGPSMPAARSRGELVDGFLSATEGAMAYAQGISGEHYAGFNLLLYDGNDLIYTSNVSVPGTPHLKVLPPGHYGLSNAELGAAWPKCEIGAERLRQTVQRNYHLNDLLDLLNDRQPPADATLPNRGRPVEEERHLAARFIVGEHYGTRASSALSLGRDQIAFIERSWLAGGVRGEDVEFYFLRRSTQPAKRLGA